MIINRELDVTQRRTSLQVDVGALATGVTTLVGIVENSGIVVSAYATAFGLSGTPTVSFSLYRFTSTGFTAIGLGATITVPAYGTSGLGVVSATTIGGVTCLQGDLVVSLSGGTNAATTNSLFGVCVQSQVDYLNFPGT